MRAGKQFVLLDYDRLRLVLPVNDSGEGELRM